jgi:hypothetical protein
MIQLHTVPTTEFTWLILEQSEVPDISDFGLLDSLCKETSFDGTKGVVIATTPPVNSGLSGKLYSFCRTSANGGELRQVSNDSPEEDNWVYRR